MPALLELHGTESRTALYGEIGELWGDFVASLPETVSVSLQGDYYLDDANQWTLAGDEPFIGTFFPETLVLTDSLNGDELGRFKLGKLGGFKLKIPKVKLPSFRGLGKFKLNLKLPRGIGKSFKSVQKSLSRGFKDYQAGVKNFFKQGAQIGQDLLSTVASGAGGMLPGMGDQGAAEPEEMPEEYPEEYAQEQEPAPETYAEQPAGGPYYDDPATQEMYGYLAGELGFFPAIAALLPGLASGGAAGAASSLLPGLASGAGGALQNLNPLSLVQNVQARKAAQKAQKSRERQQALNTVARMFAQNQAPRPAVTRPRVYVRPAPRPGGMPQVAVQSAPVMRSAEPVARNLEPEAKSDNTLLYVGLGAAGLLAVALLILTKGKEK